MFVGRMGAQPAGEASFMGWDGPGDASHLSRTSSAMPGRDLGKGPC